MDLVDLSPITEQLKKLNASLGTVIELLTTIRDENRERFRRLHPKEHQDSEAAKQTKARRP